MRRKVKHYMPGDRRIRSRFLWLPKLVDDEERWLAHATWQEEYVEVTGGYRWFAEKWLD